MKKHILFALVATLVGAAQAATTVSTLDDLTLAPESYYFPEASTTFTSGAASFSHNYTDYGFPGCCASGWTYSNQTDTTTAGYTNQYSALTGGGVNGSANYGVSFELSEITFSAPSQVLSTYVTNTTYAGLSMQQGDDFAKKFGGATGNDADFFMLTITGLNGAGSSIGSVDVYLADFRFADNSQDYILNQWKLVDLSSLGTVSALKFSLSSSDVGSYGIKTPAYFALDNLAVTTPVPETGTLLMMAAGLGLLALQRRSTRA